MRSICLCFQGTPAFPVEKISVLGFMRPKSLKSFRKLAATGCVEFLAETYSHSLSVLKNITEFQMTG